MPNKKFLETQPLYKSFKTDISWNKDNPVPVHSGYFDREHIAINMPCFVCSSHQTFNITSRFSIESMSEQLIGKTRLVKYMCTSCGRFTIDFLILFLTQEDEEESHLTLTKVGQYPAWSIEIDKDLEINLGSRAAFYKKGLISESQGYGIGAFAYYRRVVEGVIDELLEAIEDLIETENEREKYRQALKQVKNEIVAEKKIKLVQDLLPSTLRTDDYNPLKILYKELSTGLHSQTDKECLKKSELIRDVLIFLVTQVNGTRNRKRKFTSAMQKLLDSSAGKTITNQ